MSHPSLAVSEVTLSPGEYFVGDAGWRVRTLLGSCVAITIWDPRRRVGAMSHYLLASRRGRSGDGQLDGRYGDEALQLMASGLAAVGVNLRECQAQVLGGGNMFPSQALSMRVGQTNGQAARAMLQELGVPIHHEDLFGAGHRQVVFDVATGRVSVHRVPLSVQARQKSRG
ncbi:MAG TPA: chemotaxis protein CheD [Burkholderiaceae bacterium]|nr:chemotaxis protein CheD [Burkholderiaceae bacterium]